MVRLSTRPSDSGRTEVKDKLTFVFAALIVLFACVYATCNIMTA